MSAKYNRHRAPAKPAHVIAAQQAVLAEQPGAEPAVVPLQGAAPGTGSLVGSDSLARMAGHFERL